MSELGQGLTSIVVVFPGALINPEALKRAAYVMMARATTSFAQLGTDIRCTLIPVSQSEDVAAIERDFRREVLDQDLRLSIEAQTEPMRTAILGLTFSRTGLQG